MKAIINMTIIPIGVGVSLSEYVAEAQRILEGSGLDYTLHANGTNVEGEWDAVFAVVKQCVEAIHAKGAPRVHTSLAVNTRTDRDEHMAGKIASVQAKLA